MLRNSLVEVSEKDFSSYDYIQDKSCFLLRYAILAPSSFNTQPWKFSIKKSTVTLRPNYDRWLKTIDPDQRELFINLGCVLENYLVAADYFGMQCSYHLKKDEIVIHMQGQKPLNLKKEKLFQSLVKRSTYKGLFKDKMPRLSFLEKLRQVIPRGVFVSFFSSETVKNLIRSLSLEADFARFFLCPEHKNELAHWMGKRLDQLIKGLVQDIAFMFSNKKTEIKDPVCNAPVFGILFSEKDDLISRIRVGQALERIYLFSQIEGMKICPTSNILEVPQTRLKLQKIFQGYRGKIMQPFCLGYPIKTDPTIVRSRLTIEKILV